MAPPLRRRRRRPGFPKDFAGARYGQSHTVAIIGFRDPQTGIGLRLGVGDRVENDIAIRPGGLRGNDYPFRHKSDTEFLHKRFAELDLIFRGRLPDLARSAERWFFYSIK